MILPLTLACTWMSLSLRAKWRESIEYAREEREASEKEKEKIAHKTLFEKPTLDRVTVTGLTQLHWRFTTRSVLTGKYVDLGKIFFFYCEEMNTAMDVSFLLLHANLCRWLHPKSCEVLVINHIQLKMLSRFHLERDTDNV